MTPFDYSKITECILCHFRAFGDKSAPPSLPDDESEADEMDEENSEVSENDQEEETEKSLEEQTVSDQACCIKELSLTEQEGDNEGSSSNQEDDNQDEQKTPQGTENTSNNIPDSNQIQL